MKNYWQFLAASPTARAVRKAEDFSAPALPAGTRLRATDRDYVVDLTGAWRKQARPGKLPAAKSQLYFPAQRPRGKTYWKAMEP